MSARRPGLRNHASFASHADDGQNCPRAISTRQLFTVTGASETAGTTVVSAGDVNGDGYADVIVGAPFKTSPVRTRVARTSTSADRTRIHSDVRRSGRRYSATPSPVRVMSLRRLRRCDRRRAVQRRGRATRAGRTCFGGRSRTTSPTWRLTGAAINDEFGTGCRRQR